MPHLKQDKRGLRAYLKKSARGNRKIFHPSSTTYCPLARFYTTKKPKGTRVIVNHNYIILYRGNVEVEIRPLCDWERELVNRFDSNFIEPVSAQEVLGVFENGRV